MGRPPKNPAPAPPPAPDASDDALRHDDDTDASSSMTNAAPTKKRRKRRKALTEEEDIAILRAVLAIRPQHAAHGQGRRLWQEAADRVVAEVGNDMSATLCKGRYDNLIKRFVHEQETGGFWPVDATRRELVMAAVEDLKAVAGAGRSDAPSKALRARADGNSPASDRAIGDNSPPLATSLSAMPPRTATPSTPSVEATAPKTSTTSAGRSATSSSTKTTAPTPSTTTTTTNSTTKVSSFPAVRSGNHPRAFRPASSAASSSSTPTKTTSSPMTSVPIPASLTTRPAVNNSPSTSRAPASASPSAPRGPGGSPAPPMGTKSAPSSANGPYPGGHMTPNTTRTSGATPSWKTRDVIDSHRYVESSTPARQSTPPRGSTSFSSPRPSTPPRGPPSRGPTPLSSHTPSILSRGPPVSHTPPKNTPTKSTSATGAVSRATTTTTTTASANTSVRDTPSRSPIAFSSAAMVSTARSLMTSAPVTTRTPSKETPPKPSSALGVSAAPPAIGRGTVTPPTASGGTRAATVSSTTAALAKTNASVAQAPIIPLQKVARSQPLRQLVASPFDKPSLYNPRGSATRGELSRESARAESVNTPPSASATSAASTKPSVPSVRKDSSGSANAHSHPWTARNNSSSPSSRPTDSTRSPAVSSASVSSGDRRDIDSPSSQFASCNNDSQPQRSTATSSSRTELQSFIESMVDRLADMDQAWQDRRSRDREFSNGSVDVSREEYQELAREGTASRQERVELKQQVASLQTALEASQNEQAQLKEQVALLAAMVEEGQQERAELKRDVASITSLLKDVPGQAVMLEHLKDAQLRQAEELRRYQQDEEARRRVAQIDDRVRFEALEQRLDQLENSDHDEPRPEPSPGVGHLQAAAAPESRNGQPGKRTRVFNPFAELQATLVKQQELIDLYEQAHATQDSQSRAEFELAELRTAVEVERSERKREYETLLNDIKRIVSNSDSNETRR